MVGNRGGMRLNNHAITGATKQRSYSGDYKAIGTRAEEIVMQFLENRPNVIGLNDFRELKVIQESDIDIAIKTRDGLVTLAEIKSDYHLGVSGNVLFEVLRINHTAPPDKTLTLGWSGRTPAKYLLYYAPQVHSIYLCKTDDLRAALQRYTKEARKNMIIKVVETDAIKTTINILIPERYCRNVFTIYRLNQIEICLNQN